jgi:2-polyprenyl-3-methyl-5-hydroxy-6-metoxy-1,4-benzoquinol methylase
VPLPEVSRLLDLPSKTWLALGDRLRAVGFHSEGLQSVLTVSRSPLASWRRPMELWHARQRADHAANALRMLTFHDPITRKEAQDLLGDVPVDALVSAGLLELGKDGRVSSAFLFSFSGKDYVLSDELAHGGDAAMGQSMASGLLARAAAPFTRPVRRALDLGCGAGALSVALARAGASVVATDVNARAVTLTKVNAMLGGLSIDARQGDLYAPVANETFDLIVSQPPCIPQPEGSAKTTYLFGGRRGDEIVTRALAGFAPHLAEGGRAVFLVEWPATLTETGFEARVRQALPGDDLDALLLLGPRSTPEEHCLAYAEVHHPTLDAEFTRTAMLWRDHLAALGVAELRQVLHCFERAKGRAAFTSSFPVRAYGASSPTPAHLDRWMLARDIVARGPQAVFESKLVVTPGLQLGPLDEQGKAIAQPAEGSCLEPLAINQGTQKLLTVVDAAAKVRDAATSLSEATGIAQSEAEQRILPGVTQGLLLGLLEPSTRSL